MEIVGETSRYALQEHLHLITAPLQVIWGKKDQVIQTRTHVVAFASKLILKKQSRVTQTLQPAVGRLLGSE